MYRVISDSLTKGMINVQLDGTVSLIARSCNSTRNVNFEIKNFEVM